METPEQWERAYQMANAPWKLSMPRAALVDFLNDPQYRERFEKWSVGISHNIDDGTSAILFNKEGPQQEIIDWADALWKTIETKY